MTKLGRTTLARQPVLCALRLTPVVAMLLVGVHSVAAERLPAQGEDFAKDAHWLFQVGACGAPQAPAEPANPVAKAHCDALVPEIVQFRNDFVTKAERFFAQVVPAGVPERVVYPFGGGDLMSALVTYPKAREITTISLEGSSDPTDAKRLGERTLKRELRGFRGSMIKLLAKHDSATVDMRVLEQRALPAQLLFALTALSILEYTPVSLRYFRIETDGSLHYFSHEELAHGPRHDVFANSELVFRRKDGTLTTHRHVRANLDDPHFHDSGLERYLIAQGDVAALTKAASYLLWDDRFSRIRAYLMAHATYMVSDCTGLPVSFAASAGLRQTTYGTFKGASVNANPVYERAMRALWTEQPHRELQFRFGYLDREGHAHLMVTERVASH